jgi:hypothetical protein
VDGFSNQLDLLAVEVKMLRKHQAFMQDCAMPTF